MTPIYVVKPSLPPMEEYMAELSDVFESGIMTHQGPKHNKLQAELKEYMNAENITLFANGHLALEFGLEALDITDCEVITTPYTFASTTQAILRNRCTPVYCDIKDTDYTMDPEKIESLITDKTKAIVPVHVYGNICDVERIQEIADKHNLKVIYDAAHAFGERYKGKDVARFGDASMFSFHATKVFNTVEGGCFTYKDGSITEHLEGLRQFGQIVKTDATPYVGSNGKMTEVHAAMGLCNLRHMDEYHVKRKAVCDTYRERLSGIEGIKLSVVNPNIDHNYAYFPVVFEEEKTGISRDMVMEALAAEQIYARKYFWPICSDFEIIKSMGIKSDVPVAKYMSDRVITAPCYSDLAIEDVNRVCDCILKLFNR